MPKGPDLEMIRGDTPIWRFTFTRAGAPINLLGATLYFTAKRELTDPDVSAVFQKKTPGGTGWTIVGGIGDAGQADVGLTSADTSALLDRDYTLYYDVQLYDMLGGRTTFRGKLYVACDITEAVV